MRLDRRGWALAAGVAAVAAVAGAGWSLWRQRSVGADAASPNAADADALWSLSFDAPGGGRLAMATLRGQPLLLNFWATWCPPCLREMPTLDRFQRDFATNGWRVLGLAADQPEPVRAYLAHTPVSYRIGLAGLDGIELARRLGNSGGGLPFTAVFGRDGLLRQRHSGEVSRALLEAWAKGIG
ncbi:MAG: TlpA disulfide reductase family protein [Pseudomonadota bacterium]